MTVERQVAAIERENVETPATTQRPASLGTLTRLVPTAAGTHGRQRPLLRPSVAWPTRTDPGACREQLAGAVGAGSRDTKLPALRGGLRVGGEKTAGRGDNRTPHPGGALQEPPRPRPTDPIKPACSGSSQPRRTERLQQVTELPSASTSTGRVATRIVATRDYRTSLG